MTSQAQIKQRIGRVGRTSDGIAYHMYKKNNYDKLNKYPLPSIIKEDITEFILDLFKKYKFKYIYKILNDLIEVPLKNQILIAIKKLNFYKIIKLNTDSNIKINENLDGTITKFGKKILKIKNMEIEEKIMIYISNKKNCLNDILILIAINMITEYNYNKLFDYEDKKYNKNYFINMIYKGSEQITILNIYYNLYLTKNLNFLNVNMWDKIENKVNQIRKNIILKIKDNNENIENKNDTIKNILIQSYYFNTIQFDNKNNNFKTINNIVNINSDINKLNFMYYSNSDGVYSKIIKSFGNIKLYGITLYE